MILDDAARALDIGDVLGAAGLQRRDTARPVIQAPRHWSWGDDAHGDEYLAIDLLDSDIATVDYRPATGQGRFYLGFQAREYFEDPDASEPIDVDAEAARFATSARQVVRVRADRCGSSGRSRGLLRLRPRRSCRA